MAAEEKKKTKIDLKARLGKTTQMGIAPPPGAPTPPPPSSDAGGPGSGPVSGTPLPISTPAVGSVRPAPPSSGGIPLPPPGITPSIPLPPFQPAQRQAPRAEPKPVAAQQTIKVDVGEEIVLERKKSRTRALGALGVGALIGLGIGFVAGGSSEVGTRAKLAAKGAGALEKDVKAANDKLKDLDSKLTEASDKLKNKTFPEDLGSALGGLIVPFDKGNLDGKGVNGMTTNLFKHVLDYTKTVENLNKQREDLQRLVNFAKEPITKAWKEETAPVVGFAVLFRTEGKGVVADLAQVPAPGFPWKSDHPDKFKVLRPEGGKNVEKEIKRWVKGDLTGGDPVGIPVDPKATAAFSTDAAAGNLARSIREVREALQGKPDDPNAPPGLLKSGEDLVAELHKASLAQ